MVNTRASRRAYGRGAAGVDNYAQAVLAANPKASVGDFYAGYFSGTGKPGSPNFNNFDLLSKGAIQDTPGTPAAQRAAAANFVKNAGVDPSTPLASVAGGAGGPGPGNVGPVTGFLPGQSTGQGGIGSDVVASKDAGAPAAPSIASQIAGPLQALTKGLEDDGKQQQQGRRSERATGSAGDAGRGGVWPATTNGAAAAGNAIDGGDDGARPEGIKLGVGSAGRGDGTAEVANDDGDVGRRPHSDARPDAVAWHDAEFDGRSQLWLVVKTLLPTCKT